MRRMLQALLVAGLLLMGLLTPARAEPATPDPNLEQTVEADEPASSDPAEISRGHVDLGPRVVDGVWAFEARDDTAAPPVWRALDATVFRVPDAAALTLPDDPAYDFLGVEPGKQVMVVPQTENPEVLWLGWNTQHPTTAPLMDRGAELLLHRVEGPGELHVFLQNGFDAPQPLWDSRKPGPQKIWMQANTHTHANWVFTEPGVYLVDVTLQATAPDGTESSARGTLRFAVGSAASADEARSAEFTEPAEDTEQPTDPSAAPTDGSDEEPGPNLTWPLIGGAVVVVALGAVGAWRVSRSRRDKQAVWDE